jgi:hypothetical protein
VQSRASSHHLQKEKGSQRDARLLLSLRATPRSHPAWHRRMAGVLTTRLYMGAGEVVRTCGRLSPGDSPTRLDAPKGPHPTLLKRAKHRPDAGLRGRRCTDAEKTST